MRTSLVFSWFVIFARALDHAPDKLVTFRVECDRLPFRTTYIEGVCFVYKSEGLTCERVLQDVDKLTNVRLKAYKDVNVDVVATLRRINNFPNVGPDSICSLSKGYKCRDGFELFEDYCFKQFTDKKTFAEAQSTCQGLGGHIVVIQGDEVNNKIRSYVDQSIKAPIWIGLQKSNGEWRVVNGTSEWVPFYLRFLFADGSQTNAVMMNDYYVGFWNTQPPSAQHAFVCQRSALSYFQ